MAKWGLAFEIFLDNSLFKDDSPMPLLHVDTELYLIPGRPKTPEVRTKMYKDEVV